MRAGEILQTADKIVGGARQTTHGKAERSFGAIAGLWNAYIQARKLPHAALEDYDVAHMMQLLKIARALQGDKAEPDHAIDNCGYGALAGELMTKAIQSAPGPEPSDPYKELARKVFDQPFNEAADKPREIGMPSVLGAGYGTSEFRLKMTDPNAANSELDVTTALKRTHAVRPPVSYGIDPVQKAAFDKEKIEAERELRSAGFESPALAISAIEDQDRRLAERPDVGPDNLTRTFERLRKEMGYDEAFAFARGVVGRESGVPLSQVERNRLHLAMEDKLDALANEQPRAPERLSGELIQ